MGDKNEITTITNGKLAVRTTTVSGTRLPGSAEDEKKYITTYVQTDEGEVLAVKVIDLNGGGGGGGGTTDYTDLENKPSINSVTLTGNKTGADLGLLDNMSNDTSHSFVLSPNQINKVGSGTQYSVIITPENVNNVGYYQTVIGAATGAGNNQRCTVIGFNAGGSSNCATSIGSGTLASGGSGQSQGGGPTVVGSDSYTSAGTSVGSGVTSSSGVAVGRGFNSSHRLTASGYRSIAIGIVTSANEEDKVHATAQNAIQLGTGVNSTASTFQVYSYTMLDGTTGKIPTARLDLSGIPGYNASASLQRLINQQGSLKWQTQGLAFSGFSSGSNITIPGGFNPGSNSWEIVMHIKTGSSVSGSFECFFDSTQEEYKGAQLCINSGNYTNVIGGGSSPWIIGGDVNVPVNANTEYWLKSAFNGTDTYTLSSSTDGVTFSNAQTVTSTTKVSDSSYLNLGYAIRTGKSFSGVIYIPGTYIKINGEYVFNGYTAVAGTDYVVNGTPTQQEIWV